MLLKCHTFHLERELNLRNFRNVISVVYTYWSTGGPSNHITPRLSNMRELKTVFDHISVQATRRELKI